MTLAISYFQINIETNDEDYRGMPDAPGAELFGFESWRKTVWGSDEVQRYAPTFLSQLKNEDLYVTVDKLGVFENELLEVLKNTDELAVKLNVVAEEMMFRIENAISATKHAKIKGFGVCIS